MVRIAQTFLLFLLPIGSAAAPAQQSAPNAPALQQRETPVSPPAVAPPAAPVLTPWQNRMLDTFAMDFGQLARYREANAALPPPAAAEKRVVFFGDSITDFWKLDQYFPGKGYINRGIGGQTTSQMLVRFRQDVLDLQPRAVVILAGTNDIAGNTGPISLKDIESNYATLAELARLHNIQVVFCSITPVNNYTERAQPLFDQRPIPEILELNNWLKTYSSANNAVYVDYFDAMVDNKGMLRANLAEDGLHPNDAGYKIMTPLAEAALEKALAR